MKTTGSGATTVAPAVLSKTAARKLTDEVKADAASLWTKLTRLYDGGAHHALGYKSWGAYWGAEFHEAGSRGYHMLDAGRVLDSLKAHSTIVERPESEGVARELKPLAKTPEKMAEVWDEVVTESKQEGTKPTAKRVREKVERAKAELKSEPKPPPKPARKLNTVITGKPGLSHDPRVVSWVRKRYKDGWTRDQIVAATQAKTDGWPLPNDELTNGGVSECRAAIVAIERCEMLAAQAMQREHSARMRSKRTREFWAMRDGGDKPLLQTVVGKVGDMTNYLEMLSLESYDFGDDITAWDFEKLYETLVEFQTWADTITTYVDAKVSRQRKLELIRHMRENTAGMTEHERQASLAGAARMEARLDGPKKLSA